MQQKPLFSVLIANHNDGHYLQNAIDSIFFQTYPNWEIIIVDDDSSDNSVEIYKKYSYDSRFHIYHNEENKGCGFTKRRCVELANGEICGFVDADDCIVKDALSIMVEAHINHPECSIVYSNYYCTDNDLNIISVSKSQCSIPQGESFLTSKIIGAISHFVTFKKEAYLKTEGIDDSMRIAEDVDLYLKLEEVGNTFFLPEPLYFYRTQTGNNTSLGDEKMVQVLGWDVIARYSACRRRNLPIDQFSFSFLEVAIPDIKENSFKEGEESVKKTKAYQLGKKIIHTFRMIIKK